MARRRQIGTAAHAARRLRGVGAGATHPLPPAIRHRQRAYSWPGRAGCGGSGNAHAVLHADALSPRRRAATAALTAGGANALPLGHAVARHGGNDAPRPRRLHHRLVQPARRRAVVRPLGSDELVQQLVTFLRALGGNPQSGSRVPADRSRAGGRGADGRGWRPDAAAQPDANGRSDRRPRESDPRQRSGPPVVPSSGSKTR